MHAENRRILKRKEPIMVSEISIILEEPELNRDPIGVFGFDSGSGNSIVIRRFKETGFGNSMEFSIQLPAANVKKLVQDLTDEIKLLEKLEEVRKEERK
jgi:hypothetical protein